MANNYVQPGEVIDHVPAENVASGEAIVIGARIGVAQTDVAAGEEGEFAVTDVHTLPKNSGAIDQGVDVYLTGAGNITTTATDNTLAGYAFTPAASGDSFVAVKINA